MELNVNQLKSITWVTLIVLTISIACSGVLIIFIFDKDLFLKIETIKLLLLAISITCPIWLLNSIIYAANVPNEDQSESNEHIHVTGLVGGMITALIFYIPILLNFFFLISLRKCIVILLSLELIIILLGTFPRKKKIKNK
jgi:hypothetical protein